MLGLIDDLCYQLFSNNASSMCSPVSLMFGNDVWIFEMSQCLPYDSYAWCLSAMKREIVPRLVHRSKLCYLVN
jgi:hypothetical protein